MQTETKTTSTGSVQACQNCKQNLVIEPEDFAFYEKMKVPPPTWCPECRLKRRMVWRNERNLYRVKDAASGQEVFSGIQPQSGLTVYEHDYWWSDKWDPMDYGRDYDFSRPFFEQLKELAYETPWPARNIQNLVNSDYSNNAGDLKNCYLCFNSGEDEDSAYIADAYKTKNSFDVFVTDRVELSYESVEIENCYKTFFSIYCDDSNGIWFSRDLTGCTDCFGCVNLRSKQYYIFNKPYTKEAYFEELAKMRLDTFSGLEQARKRAYAFWQLYPYKFFHGVQNVNVSGECIHNAKNVFLSYDVEDIEDSKFCHDVSLGVKDSYDFSNWGDKVERMYEVYGSGEGCKDVKFTVHCWPAISDVEYSIECHSSSNLFACVGLKKKSYCIFNKQYTPEEYFALRGKIIRHMDEMPYTDSKGRIYRYGEFFPPEFSPFSYQETIAQDYFPETKAGAKEKGYNWRDIEPRVFEATLKAADILDSIHDISDSILQDIIECGSCGKAYRIIREELQFLRTYGIPIPRMCVDCRYAARHSLRNQPHYYNRTCTCSGVSSENNTYQNQVSHFHGSHHCPDEVITAFSPTNPAIVYCDQCYNAEVV